LLVAEASDDRDFLLKWGEIKELQASTRHVR